MRAAGCGVLVDSAIGFTGIAVIRYGLASAFWGRSAAR